MADRESNNRISPANSKKFKNDVLDRLLKKVYRKVYRLFLLPNQSSRTMVLRLHFVIKDLPGFSKKISKLPREIQKLMSCHGITKSAQNYHGEMDFFRIGGGNGTEKTRIEQESGDKAGELKGKICRPRHDEAKRKLQTPKSPKLLL